MQIGREPKRKQAMIEEELECGLQIEHERGCRCEAALGWEVVDEEVVYGGGGSLLAADVTTWN